MTTVNKGMLRKVLRTMDMDYEDYIPNICHLLGGGELKLKEVPEVESFTYYLSIDLGVGGTSKEDYLNNVSDTIDEVLTANDLTSDNIISMDFDSMESTLDVSWLAPTSELTKLGIEEENIKITKALTNFDKIKSLYLAELKKYNMDEKSQVEQQIKELQTKLEELNNEHQ